MLASRMLDRMVCCGPAEAGQRRALLNCSRRKSWVVGVLNRNPIEPGLSSAVIVLVISGNGRR